MLAAMGTDLTRRLSATGYARYRGVARSSVLTAIRTGRISGAASRGRHRWEIDPEVADRLWVTNTDPRARGNRPADGAARPPGSSAGSEADDETLAEARLRLEKARADRSEWRRQREFARLVRADNQAREIRAIGLRLRGASLEMVDRLAPVLSKMRSEREVHGLLKHEIVATLRTLCESTREDVSG